MLARNTLFHLNRGRQMLTIAKLAERYIGMIDGRLYIIAASPDAVVRHLLSVRSEPVKKSDPSRLVQAARQFAGDAAEDTTPLSDEERAVMDEVRREAGRPSKADIRKEVKKLLG